MRKKIGKKDTMDVFLNVKFREFNLLIPFAENGDLLYQHKISVIL